MRHDGRIAECRPNSRLLAADGPLDVVASRLTRLHAPGCVVICKRRRERPGSSAGRVDFDVETFGRSLLTRGLSVVFNSGRSSAMQTKSTSRAEDMERETNNEEGGSFKSLKKALAILDAAGSPVVPLRIAEAAIKAGVSRPTADRVVQTLIANGCLAEDPQSGRLSIGLLVLILSSSLLHINRLRRRTLGRWLRLPASVRTLASCTRTKWSYLAGVDKPTLPRIYSLFGKTAPAHCSSLGKAILAHFPEAELQAQLAAAPLESMTPHSITSMRRFMKELANARLRGRPRRACSQLVLRGGTDLRQSEADRWLHRHQRRSGRTGSLRAGGCRGHRGRSTRLEHRRERPMLRCRLRRSCWEVSWKQFHAGCL
jgi:IclR family KDG regulon transcriptional repressor